MQHRSFSAPPCQWQSIFSSSSPVVAVSRDDMDSEQLKSRMGFPPGFAQDFQQNQIWWLQPSWSVMLICPGSVRQSQTPASAASGLVPKIIKPWQESGLISMARRTSNASACIRAQNGKFLWLWGPTPTKCTIPALSPISEGVGTDGL